jgi:hypothetical protein
MEEIKNIQYGETTQKYDYDISDSATITLLNKIKEEAATREDEDNKLLEKINKADLKYYYPDEQATATGIVSTSELSFVVTVDNNGNKKVRLHVYNLPNIELLVNIAPHSVDEQTTANPSFTIKVNNLTEDPKGVISPIYHWYVNDVLQELITGNSYQLSNVASTDNKTVKIIITDYRGRTSTATFNTNDLFLIFNLMVYVHLIPTATIHYYRYVAGTGWTEIQYSDLTEAELAKITNGSYAHGESDKINYEHDGGLAIVYNDIAGVQTKEEADNVMKTIPVDNYQIHEKITSATDLSPIEPIIYDTNRVPAWPYLIAPSTLTEIRIAYQNVNGTYIESLPIKPNSGSVVVGNVTIDNTEYTILRMATAATDFNNMHAKIIDII